MFFAGDSAAHRAPSSVRAGGKAIGISPPLNNKGSRPHRAWNDSPLAPLRTGGAFAGNPHLIAKVALQGGEVVVAILAKVDCQLAKTLQSSKCGVHH